MDRRRLSSHPVPRSRSAARSHSKHPGNPCRKYFDQVWISSMRFSSQCRQKTERNELPRRSSDVNSPLDRRECGSCIPARAHVTLVRLKRHGSDNRGQRVSSGRSGDGSRNRVSQEFVGTYGSTDLVGSKIELTTDGRNYWKVIAAGNGYFFSDSRRLRFGPVSATRTKHVKPAWLIRGSGPRHSGTPALCCHRRPSQGRFSALKRDSPRRSRTNYRTGTGCARRSGMFDCCGALFKGKNTGVSQLTGSTIGPAGGVASFGTGGRFCSA